MPYYDRNGAHRGESSRSPALRRLRLLCLAVMMWSLYRPGAAAASSPSPTDADDLAAFFDAFVPAQMARHDLPGVTLAVVAGGEPVFLKGYGYADIAQHIEVDPQETLFDVGSVAKLFTFTAVMQLAEQGRLDLHADVNRYLTRFQVPATFSEPVTAAHLLTHTGGFDEWDIGAAARSAEEVLAVCDYLAQRLPPRVRPPGELIAYSNHGTALAGCLVEEISGLTFAAYIEAHILSPLGMARSTFVWPADLMEDMATGYGRANGALAPMDIYYRHFGPAGELKTTAADMTRFMLAHLRDGAYQGARILEPETAREMHRQQFTHHPRLPGFTYGFFEDVFNGRRALVHGGDTNPIFSSLLVLLPEEQVGLFVAHNTADYAFRETLVQAFVDRYFPAEKDGVPPQPLPGYGERAERFVGRYAPTFMVRETSLEKLLTAAAQFRVTADAEGVLALHESAQMPGDVPVQWVEVAPLSFQRLDGHDEMIFFEDERGHLTHMATTRYPGAAFVRRGWLDAPALHLGLLLGSGLLFLSAVVVWVVRRRRGGLPWRQHLLALVGALNLLFVLGLVVMLQALAFDAIFGLPGWAHGLLSLPVLTAGLTLAAAVGIVGAWRARDGTVAARLYESLILAAALVFLWQIVYWNLTVLHL